MTSLATGTVTFLFTDVEGSTKLLNAHPDAYRHAIRRHHDLLVAAIHLADGAIFETVGDAVYAAFSRPTDAVKAALSAQLSLQAEPWGDTPIRVRMGVHLGEVELQGGHYFGAPLYRCARLMATAHGSQTVLSEVATAAVRDTLPPGVTLLDLGEHRLKDLIRPERISQLDHPTLPTTFPPLRSLDTLPNNLPLQSTPLIGREREVDEVLGHLSRADVRLLTLLGPGGTGKTRLALQVAADALDDPSFTTRPARSAPAFSHGAFFVPLETVSDASSAASAVAHALGVQAGDGQTPLTAACHYLRERRLLLVLDNLEQLDGASPLVRDLLAAGPGVKVLATSRASLRLSGEHEYHVPALGLPDAALTRAVAQRAATPDEIARLSQYAAVRLFIDRARSMKYDFEVTNENAPAVAEMCLRLDGLPLAIELAAARVRLLKPEQMLARLEERGLALLVGGARDLPARQRTLRAAIAWSYDLLTREEQSLIRALAIFDGGCTLDAAEAVCDVGASGDILDGVESLLAQTLLRQEAPPGCAARLTMLTTIREFAAEQLEAHGERVALVARHAAHQLAVAEQLALVESNHRLTPPQLREADADFGNSRAAMEWYLAQDAAAGLRLATALWWWAPGRGHGETVYAWLRQLLPRVSERSALRARALVACAELMATRTSSEQAEAAARESLEIAEEVGDATTAIYAIVVLGRSSNRRGHSAAAHALFEDAVGRSRELGNEGRLRISLLNVGIHCVNVRQTDRARVALDEVVRLARRAGDWGVLGQAINLLGQAARSEGNYAEAVVLLEESLDLMRAADRPGGVLWTLGVLAWIACRQDDLARAAALLREALPLAHNHGWPGLMANALFSSSAAAHRAGSVGEGVRLAGAAFRLDHYEQFLFQDERDAHRVAMDTARATLGDSAFDSAWAEGQALTDTQAFAVAVTAVESIAAAVAPNG